jgi:thiol-disulfide isomerase/thioredoxin
MRESVRFAATFLSLLLLAAAGNAADLRDVKDPARVMDVFPARAELRLLNVWATWCIPCVEEMPDLRAIDETFGPELAVAGVTLDDMIPDAKRATVTGFLDKLRIGFPNVYYTGLPDALGDRIKFSGEIPVTLIYDRRGKELWRHQGRIDKNKTIAEIRRLLRRKQ